jgi:hypothetical protein
MTCLSGDAKRGRSFSKKISLNKRVRAGSEVRDKAVKAGSELAFKPPEP